MKYHTLFLSKTRKDVAILSSAAVVIDALRANNHAFFATDQFFPRNSRDIDYGSQFLNSNR